jgi:hypothetical protein
VARPLTEAFRRSQMLPEEELSPVATAYARARGGDRMSAFGDVAAVSDVVDVSLANLLRREVSDAIIAPGYEPEALAILKQKRKGNYLILQMDPGYQPPLVERREVFGFQLTQERNNAKVTPELLANVVTARQEIPADAVQSLLVAFSVPSAAAAATGLIDQDELDASNPFSRDPNQCSFAQPQYCSNMKSFFSISGAQRNSIRAGGNGAYGRRDFVWQSGGEGVLQYQKRNVLGFAFDHLGSLGVTAQDPNQNVGIKEHGTAPCATGERTGRDLPGQSGPSKCQRLVNP